MRRTLLVVWVALVVHTVVFAPAALPSPMLELGRRLTLFDWPERALPALWYATGAVLFLHATFYLAERPQHRPHPLPVLLASPIFGSLILLPYYALRRREPVRQPWRWPWRLLRYVLIVELVGFSLYGLLAGDLAALWHEVTHRRFSHFLLIDCAIMLALLPAMAAGKLDDVSDAGADRGGTRHPSDPTRAAGASPRR
jgi:hypothetical protein